jgi:DNA-binding transcriptional ArsR family regulator/rhodanese-related sulfurtransferase
LVAHSQNRKKKIEESRELLNSYLANTALMLSTPVRLTILTTLAQAPRTVDELCEVTFQSMANVSQHLAKLKTARLVSVEKRGVQRVYTLASPAVHKVVVALQELARSISSEVEQAENTLIAPELRAQADLQTILNEIESDRANLIDVRTPHEQESTPVSNALQIPVETDEDLQKVLAQAHKSKPVYVFCRGAYCATASRTAEYLREHGIDAWCLRETSLDLKNAEQAKSKNSQSTARKEFK